MLEEIVIYAGELLKKILHVADRRLYELLIEAWAPKVDTSRKQRLPSSHIHIYHTRRRAKLVAITQTACMTQVLVS